MRPACLPFFVYGTLRPGERNHDRVLRGRVASVEAAVLPGTLLFDGPGYPYAVDDPRGAGRVHGELVEPLPEAYDEVLADLDRLEEYVPGAPGNLYERVVREVRCGDGARRAWVYLAAGPIRQELLASGRRAGGDWRSRRGKCPR
ncbi:gamma-glutamylcyclotransferase [Streptomyces sp. RB6PN25]|uniref:Gamma-glutamylcyclotransferase n=1 Tax=Streptomyces humicola TaxID=2953240 RepID=A0ABT1PWG9_9ACTN|nr:gamma-glutamylcyclotransferase family protein [Streptomyces humicola]MCQ4082018.1 gamma-glutamylcyclotransferase [Streptomyces humicola]